MHNWETIKRLERKKKTKTSICSVDLVCFYLHPIVDQTMMMKNYLMMMMIENFHDQIASKETSI
jgi:hypothetical protein